ncbi:MAG TPA: hypothetical protein VKM93_19670 [Terriglobia bacterium]|nr:hypothetical protein [Terriglobia bacterium]
MYLAWAVIIDLHAGTDVSKRRTEQLDRIYEEVKGYAYGKQVKRRVDPLENLRALYDRMQLEPDYVTENIPGKLKPPLPALLRDIQEIRHPLEEFMTIAREFHKDIVVIFDGLDRLLGATKFWSVVFQDLRLFRELKVSILATAPLSVLFGVGIGQSASDHFDRIHHLAVIAANPEDGSLRPVLEKRGGYELLTRVEADSICHYSGGVLRDLISLARDAAEEAYVSDRDSVTAADVEKVVRQLGTGYLRGLGPEAIRTLLDLEGSGSFRIDQPANVELLVTRRVLEYSSTDFRVHPALLSVIPRPEPKSA